MTSGSRPRWALVTHGGSGVIDRGDLSPEQEMAYRGAMAAAAEAGGAVLRAGGSALDAVEATIQLLEDDPLFNAGRGAAFTAEGRNELDASIMDGATLAAGAVAGLITTRHPIAAARAVIEGSDHVLLGGEGADAFARSQGLEQVDPSYFFTERRWLSLEEALAAAGLPIPERSSVVSMGNGARGDLVHDEGKRGTVGCVALDIHGDVAAGTSTGGTTAKRWGRVGDSPLIGAGTYASNRAHEICALVQHKRMTLQAAADHVIQGELGALGGEGGVIAIARDGQMAWSFNTSGMYRAKLADGQPLVVGIYKDDP